MNSHLYDLKKVNTLNSTVTSTRSNMNNKFYKAIQSRLYKSPIKRQHRNHSTESGKKNAEIASETKAIAPSRLDRLLHTIETQLLQPRTLPIPRWITPRSIQFTLSEIFGHASFVLVAVSYATDDFLLLRVIAVAGSTSMLVFAYFHPHGRVLWLPFKWNLLFILINGYRIVKALYYRNVGRFMSSNLKSIKNEYFESMDMVDYAQLIRYAEEEEFEEGDVVVLQGRNNHYVRMVTEGRLNVMRDGVWTYALEEGNFVSEGGLHAGLMLDGSIESCCTIVAGASPNGNKAKCLRWNRTELVELLKGERVLRRALQAVLTWDIVRKLKGQRQSLAEHRKEIVDTELWTQKRNEQNEDRYAGILHNMVLHPEKVGNSKRRGELDHYRKIHHIDDEHHAIALQKCGWTIDEYNEGHQKDENNHESDLKPTLQLEG